MWKAAPLLKEDLYRVLDKMGGSVKDIRDKALLLVGFGGAFRRSELVGLDRQDVEITHQGQVVHIRRSKTDQFGAGRKIGTLLVGGGHRPVAALEEWLTVAAISDGAIFRRVDRHRNIHPKRISAEAVALIVKERAAATGLNAEVYSGHSLRAGFATSAATAGMPTWKIRQQTGHASDTMLGRYIRNANTFTDVFEEGAVT